MMAVHPSEIWNKFVELPENGSTTIAVNDETGYSIYMVDDNVHCSLVVCDETGEPVNEYYIYSPADAELEYVKALKEIGNTPTPDDEISDDDMRLYIEENEGRLNAAAEDFIYEILNEAADELTSAEIEQAAVAIKEFACEVLAQQFGAAVYRPMELVREDGTHFFEDYPYPYFKKEPEKAPT